LTRLVPGTAAMVMSPLGALRVPVLMTCPPTKVRLPLLTDRSPALMMLPGVSLVKAKLLGVPVRAL